MPKIGLTISGRVGRDADVVEGKFAGVGGVHPHLFASRVGGLLPHRLEEVADECIQILGGYGLAGLAEHGTAGCERMIEKTLEYGDVRLNRIGAGTDEVMLDVIGRSYGLFFRRRRPGARPGAPTTGAKKCSPSIAPCFFSRR